MESGMISLMENNKNCVARFEKISKESYEKIKRSENKIMSTYDEIKLPTRATFNSAGYDFYLTRNIVLIPNESVVINTGIRVYIEPGWFLMVAPKSGLGFKYNMMLANTIGIIDADYYNSVTDDNSNEGHIMIKLVNKGEKTIYLDKGNKFCQGIFLPYGICFDESTEEMKERNGGFSSTGK